MTGVILVWFYCTILKDAVNKYITTDCLLKFQKNLVNMLKTRKEQHEPCGIFNESPFRFQSS